MNSQMHSEHDAWTVVVDMLKRTGAVTQQDCDSPATADDTPGQQLFIAIREWGDSLVSLRNSSRGFSLVELMICVVVIGILAAIAIPNFIAMQDRAKEARVKANMHVVQLAAEDFAVWNDGVYSETGDAAMGDGLPLVNPFGGVEALETANAPSAVPGIVAYGYGATFVIGGGGPGSLIGVRPPNNGYHVGGYGKSSPLSLVLAGGE